MNAYAGSYRIINVFCAVLAAAGALGVARFFSSGKEMEANQSPPETTPEPVGAGLPG